MIRSPHRRPALVAGLLTIAALVPGAGPAVAGSAQVSLLHRIGSKCVTLNTASTGAPLKLTLQRDAIGIGVRDNVPLVDDTEVCFSKTLKAGDMIVVRQGSVAIHTTPIPSLKLTMNAATDIISGEVPTGGLVPLGGVELEDRIGGVLVYSTMWSPVLDPVGSGRLGFSADLTGDLDVRGGDTVSLGWYPGPIGPTTDMFIKSTAAPSAVIGVNRSSLSGYARPGSQVTIRVLKGRTLKGVIKTRASSVNGSWKGTLRLNGKVVRVQPGWKVFHSGFGTSPIVVARTNGFTASAEAEGSGSVGCFPEGQWIILRGNGSQVVNGITEGDPARHYEYVGGATAGEKWQLRCENLAGGGQAFVTTVTPAP